MACVYRALDKV